MSIKHFLSQNKRLYDRARNIYLKWNFKRNEMIAEGGADAVRNELTKKFEKWLHYTPDFENPQSFNEKMNWLKLYYYDENIAECCDKNRVRDYVKNKGLEDLLIPQIGVFKTAEEIDFEKLPDKFVLKPSHDSGHTIICNDKNNLNIKDACKRLDHWLKTDYVWSAFEWCYHNDNPVIVCETLLEDNNVDEIYDYKFFCFNGEPQYIFFVSDRKHHAKSDFYDMNWKRQTDFRWMYEPSGIDHPMPVNFEKMKEYARILSKDFPFVRVDFYEVNGKVYFGEMTFFHGGGYGWFEPREYDYKLGHMLNLPSKSEVNPWTIIKRK